MTIVRAQGPTGGVSVVGQAVTQLMTRGPGTLTAAIGGAAVPQAAQPIQLFGLKLSDIIDDDFLKRAVPIGWRYLITNPGSIAVADVTESGSGAPRFGRLIRGTIAERLEQAADLADRQYAAAPLTFEARILEIPSLYVTALWLHGPREIFFPFLEDARKNTLAVQEDPSFTSRVLQAAALKRQNP
jgi:hypothetical protein